MALIRKIKDGETTIYPITVDQAVFVGKDETTLDEALNNKADKVINSGGFAGGYSASAISGGAVGAGASTLLGGAIGQNASATTGGAVGQDVITGPGFAGGKSAKTVTSTGTSIDAIQLGTGTNSNKKTLQVYDYQLMDAGGNIPQARISNALPNIKKNPSDTNGDIIDTHLTIGSRNVSNDTRDFLTVYGGINQYRGSTKLGEGSSSVEFGKTAIPVQHGYAHHMALLSNNIKTVGGNDTVFINSSGVDRDATVEGNWDRVVTINAIHPEFASHQIITGHYNSGAESGANAGTYGTAFIIGNGTADTARSNAFRVAYNGSVYGKSAFNSSGADYAEYFEWVDSNSNDEDRRGLFVTCIEDKIQLANPGDDIIGVISANPSVIGNAQEDTYKDMYEKDVFGAPIKDEDGNYKLNPNYDSSKEYIPYSERPEFGIVGLLGQLIVIDDGTCTVGGYCTSSNNGIGTKSDKGYKVLKRIDSNHIKILVK